MDKLSIYEFLSFFMPGVLGVVVILQFMPKEWLTLINTSEAILIIMAGLLALMMGLVIHRFTFFLLKYGWYKKLAYKPIDRIVAENDRETSAALLKLNTLYNPENLSVGKLFDKAYYYLLLHDQSSSPVAFQSMYFFLRNILSFCLAAVPVCILPGLICDSVTVAAQHTSILLIILFCMSLTANFYRAKMVVRVFNLYLTAMEK